MKIETLKQRLSKNRPTSSVTINIPEDVIEDLKRIAPKLGFSNYQSLIRAYIGQGLRVDLERLENDKVTALIALALLDASPKVSYLREEVQKFGVTQANADEGEERLMYDSAVEYQIRKINVFISHCI